MVEKSVENVENSDNSSVKPSETGHSEVDTAKDAESANQFGLGHSRVEDFAIEAPYSDSEEQQDSGKLDIDIDIER